MQTSSKSVENKKQKLVIEKNLRNMFCQNWSKNIFEKQSNHNLDKTTNSIHRKYQVNHQIKQIVQINFVDFLILLEDMIINRKNVRNT